MKALWILSLFIVILFLTPSPDFVHTETELNIEEELFRISYTSRDRAGSTLLEEGETAWGDHVLLNATFLSLSENVTSSRLSILTIEDENITLVENNRMILYDTYLLGKNATASIHFEVIFENDTSLFYNYETILFANFFAPMIENLTIDDTNLVVGIDWDVYDINQDDQLLCNIYFNYTSSPSPDSDKEWWLLVANITETEYHWDMVHYRGLRDYRIRIEVVENTSLRLIDTSESDRFEAGSMSLFASLPNQNISIHAISYPLTYFEGDTDRRLAWEKLVSFFGVHPDTTPAAYYIYRNGTQIKEGTITYGAIYIDIDGLEVGVYNYTLYVTHKNHSATSTIFITVQTRGFVPFPISLEQWGLIFATVIILGIGLLCLRDKSRSTQCCVSKSC